MKRLVVLVLLIPLIAAGAGGTASGMTAVFTVEPATT